MVQRKLSRKGAERKALLRSLMISLFKNDRIETTEPKAKEAQRSAEKLITTAKDDTRNARKKAMSILNDKEAVTRLFEDVAPRFMERPGGYTRILKLGPRRGDGAEMAILELVE
ncbi:50S ribosomal protein L17 [Acetohalobium arabaticum]|uniref:Large ribosomal subunit protein bL17 n=1 Tax=Acetohalobium arabaticum (strain ATCC 49924 / DSM 5501 / Z-7288) TaxID=574087 RepID=D9QTH7_ACEAZ|nr:50S ribosomal protein L17 [Acetohalobium arabaticum]ADL11741.1 LSU ribosomal protein L17P [Acetohalobium arabaticum DSM 5501]